MIQVTFQELVRIYWKNLETRGLQRFTEMYNLLFPYGNREIFYAAYQRQNSLRQIVTLMSIRMSLDYSDVIVIVVYYAKMDIFNSASHLRLRMGLIGKSDATSTVTPRMLFIF